MMFRILNLLLFFILSGCSASDNPVKPKADKLDIPESEGWTLVWNDEFNGTSLVISKWEYEVNGKGGINNELQYYTNRPENLFVKDCVLVIKTLKGKYGGSYPQNTHTGKSYSLKTGNFPAVHDG